MLQRMKNILMARGKAATLNSVIWSTQFLCFYKTLCGEEGFTTEPQFRGPVCTDEFVADYAIQEAKGITLCMASNKLKMSGG